MITPTTYSGCRLWIDPATGVTLSSGRVSLVADQSGQGNDLAQTAAAYRPVNAATVPPSIQFDLGDASSQPNRRQLSSAITINAQSFTLALVFDFQSLQNGVDQMLAAIDGGGRFLAFLVNNSYYLGYYSGSGGVVTTSLRPRSGKNVLVITGSATAYTMRLNGVSVAFGAWPAGSFSTLDIGSAQSLFFYHGNLFRVAAYDTALSDASGLQGGLMADFSVPSAPTGVAVFDGDSYTEGFATSANVDYVRAADLSASVAQYKVAKAGQIWEQCSADASAQVDTLYVSGVPFVVSAFCGYNNLAGGQSASTVLSLTQSYANARKAANPTAKVIIYTTARTGTTANGYNALLYADFPTAHPTLAHVFLPGSGVTYADYLVDVAALALTLPDGTHPDDAGHALIGGVVGPLLSSLFVTAPVITSSATATATVGSPFVHQLTFTGDPTSVTVTGLPSWATYNAGTKQITGTPV